MTRRLARATIFGLVTFCLAFIAFHAIGCTALDQAVPQYAAHPATTQPAADGSVVTTQPATPRNVPAQIGTVMENVATNPAVQAGASAVPYGNLIASAIGALGGLMVFVFGQKTGPNANNAATAYLNTLQAATQTTDAAKAVAAAHAAIATAPAAASPAPPPTK